MTTLHLGVIDIPYHTQGPAKNKVEARNARRNAARAAFGGQEYHGTTGEIADILEARYHVMEIFYELHQADIAKTLEQTIGDQLEDLLSGAPPGNNSMIAATSNIEAMFQAFIDKKEMDGVQPGVPTAAAKAGVNHRLKHPFAKSNPERPSFKDTGLYMQSFRSWIE